MKTDKSLLIFSLRFPSHWSTFTPTHPHSMLICFVLLYFISFFMEIDLWWKWKNNRNFMTAHTERQVVFWKQKPNTNNFLPSFRHNFHYISVSKIGKLLKIRRFQHDGNKLKRECHLWGKGIPIWGQFPPIESRWQIQQWKISGNSAGNMVSEEGIKRERNFHYNNNFAAPANNNRKHQKEKNNLKFINLHFLFWFFIFPNNINWNFCN